MINDIIESIKKSKKRRENISEENKKKYWKLPASERLHYDSRIEKINKDNETAFFSLTFAFFKIFFYFFVFLLVIKLLADLDKEIFTRVLSILLPILPLIFKISITADIFMIFINIFYRNRYIKKLNKRFGFNFQD